MSLRLLAIPNYQCPKCFGIYNGVVSEDKNFVTFTHSAGEDDCENKDKSVTTSVSDYLEMIT